MFNSNQYYTLCLLPNCILQRNEGTIYKIPALILDSQKSHLCQPVELKGRLAKFWHRQYIHLPSVVIILFSLDFISDFYSHSRVIFPLNSFQMFLIAIDNKYCPESQMKHKKWQLHNPTKSNWFTSKNLEGKYKSLIFFSINLSLMDQFISKYWLAEPT